MEHNKNAFAPEAATDEPASPDHKADADAGGLLDFEPVPLRYRHDGLTPEKQREYVEALADTGVGRAAAARIGVSERSIARLRRRADAKSFNLACEAARRIGARRLHALAWERAIEGTIKGHYYHGELKSEERVYDNRLLIYLLGKTEHLLDEPPEAAAVAGNWEPFVEAMEQGLPPPDLRSAWERERDEMLAADAAAEEDEDEDEEDENEDGLDREEVWEEDDGWLTSFPPPADFDGAEDGVPGTEDYRRTLTEAEAAALAAGDGEQERDRAEAIRRACARRDRHFGFEGGLDPWALPGGEAEDEAPEEADNFSPVEAGLSGRSEPPVADAQPSAGAGEPGGERSGAALDGAGPAGMAELYEPSWLRSRRARGRAGAGEAAGEE